MSLWAGNSVDPYAVALERVEKIDWENDILLQYFLMISLDFFSPIV